MDMIIHKPLSIICGEEGRGRSAVITMASRYSWQRRKLKNGVSEFSNKI